MGNIFLLGSCFITINLLFIVVASLIRYLPQIMSLAARIAIGSVRVAIPAYSAFFQRLSAPAFALTGFQITTGLGRGIASVGLSLVLATVFYLVAGQRFPWLIFGSGALHGLFVTHLWEKVLFSDNLNMGEEVG